VLRQFHLSEPGQWTGKKNGSEIGKLEYTHQGIKYAHTDRKHSLSTEEKEELDKLVAGTREGAVKS
jgi:hypothetical protein